MTDGPSGDIVPFEDRMVNLLPEDQRHASVMARERIGERIGGVAVLREGWEGTSDEVHAAAILDVLDVEPDAPSLLAAVQAGEQITEPEVATGFYSTVFDKLLNSSQVGDITQRVRLGIELVDAHIVEGNKNVAFSSYGMAANTVGNHKGAVDEDRLRIYTELLAQLRTRQMDIIDEVDPEDGAINRFATAKSAATTNMPIPDDVRLRGACLALDLLPNDRQPEEALEIIGSSTDPDLIARGLRDVVGVVPELKQTWVELDEKTDAARRRYYGAEAAVETYGRSILKDSNVYEPRFFGGGAARQGWKWAKGQSEKANSAWNDVVNERDKAAKRFNTVTGTVDELAAAKLTALTATDEGKATVTSLIEEKEGEDAELFKNKLATSFNEFYDTFAKTGPEVGVTAETLDTTYRFLGSHGIIPDLKVS